MHHKLKVGCPVKLNPLSIQVQQLINEFPLHANINDTYHVIKTGGFYIKVDVPIAPLIQQQSDLCYPFTYEELIQITP